MTGSFGVWDPKHIFTHLEFLVNPFSHQKQDFRLPCNIVVSVNPHPLILQRRQIY